MSHQIIKIDGKKTKIKGNPFSIFNIAIRVGNNGETFEDIEKEMEKIGKKKAKEKGKMWGECESCEQTTVLVAEVGLCGPCCFGEAETINGNW